MFGRLRKPVTTKETMGIVFVMHYFRRVFAVLGILGMIWGYVPWNLIKAETTDDSAPEIVTSDETILEEYPTTTDSDFDPSEVAIDVEVEEERTETTKTFRKVDGTYEVAMYDDVVHFFEDGLWKQVDNSLVDDGDVLENKDNKFKVKFPKYLDDNKQIKMTMGDYSIDWNILNITSSPIEYDNTEITPNNIKELKNISSSVYYSNIQNNVDIEYILTGSQVKENIILHQYTPDFSMTFEYKLKDLSLIQDAFGEILFVNDENDVVFTFSDLYMTDSNLDLSVDIECTLVDTGNKTYEITITPNDEWLETAVYPVTIDPSIEISGYTSTASLKDKYVWNTGSSETYNYMKVGNSSSQIYRSYLEIALLDIPENSIITYSNLRLSSYANYCDDDACQVNIRVVNQTSEWTDITNNSFNDVDNQIIDYEFVEIDENPVNYYYWDFTKAMKDWHANSVDFGILELINDNEIPSDYVWFYTEEKTTLGPMITIGYQNTTGMYNYWTYHDVPVGDAGTAFISDYTGELSLIRNDFSTDHSGMNINFSMIYVENLKDIDSGYGLGWRTIYDSYAYYDSNRKYLIEPSGAEVDFIQYTCSYVTDVPILQTMTDCYLAEDGSNRVMVQYGATENVYIYTQDQLEYKYVNNRLEQVKDIKTEFYNDIVYSGTQIDYVMDHYGNKLDFTYSGMYLNKISAYLCQTWDSNDFCLTYNQVEEIGYSYSYNSMYTAGELWKVSYMKDYAGDNNIFEPGDTDAVEYDYYLDGEMKESLASTGESAVFNDTNSNKVLTFSYFLNSSLLGYIDITYEANHTIFEDHLGNINRYSFDGYGHTINILDNNGYASFYHYYNPFSIAISIPNYSMNHRIAESSQPQKTQLNPVSNHSFESNTSQWYLTVDYLAGLSSIKTNGSGTTFEESLNGYQSLYLYLYPSQTAHYYQSLILDEGYYTLSGYAKTNGVGTARLKVNGDISGATQYSSSTSSEEWTYLKVSFEVLSDNSSVTINLYNNSGGDAYFDNIQIVDGFQDTRQNLLYNQSFEINTTGWTLDGATSVTFEINDFNGLYDQILGDKHIQIIGDPEQEKYIEGTVFLTEEYNNSNYIFGLWVKGDVTPNKYDEVSYNDRLYGLEIDLLDENSNIVYTGYLPFDSFIEDWQYVVKEVFVPSGIATMNFRAIFQGEGTVYFDGFQLYRESLGDEYSYDEYGNIQTVTNPNSDTALAYYYQNGSVHMLNYVVDESGNTIDSRYLSSALLSSVETYSVTSYMIRNDNNQVYSIRIGEDNDDDGIVGDSLTDDYYQTYQFYSDDFQYIDTCMNEFGETIRYDTNLLNGLLEAIDNEFFVETTFEYDKDGRIFHVSLDSSNNTYLYVDDLLDEIQVNGFTYKLYYDEFDRLEEVKIGTGSGAGFVGSTFKEYTFTQDGVDTNADGIDDTFYETSNISEEIYGNGDGIKFTYDDENNISGVWFKTCDSCSYIQRYEYIYNQSGAVSVLKDLRDDEEYYYDYDISGRIKKVTSQDGDVTSYEYDNAGNLTVYSYDIPNDTVEVIYDYHVDPTDAYDSYQLGLYDKTVFDEYSKEYIYESDGLRRLSVVFVTLDSTLLNLITYEYMEDDDVLYGNTSNRILTITQEFDGGTYSQTLSYTDNGFIETITNQSNQVIEYYYDDLDELRRENNQIDNYTYVYNYDNYGNVTSQYYYSFISGDSSLGVPLYYETYTYDTTWKDQLATVTRGIPLNQSSEYTITYSYDGAGNVTTVTDSRGASNTVSHTWEGRSLETYSSYLVNASYTYNQNGIRNSKTVNNVTTTYYLDGSTVLYETDGTNLIYYTYDVDGSLLTINYNGTDYYYVLNVLGDVTHLLDSTGNIVVEYRYDAFGNIEYMTNSTLAHANPYRYRGYRYDEESGYYYLQSRYYNPDISRFISADGLLQSSSTVLGHNMYAYTNNNPVMYTDYSGYKATIGDWIFVVGLAVVCVALVAVAAPVLFLGAAYLSTGAAIAMFSTGAIVGSKMLTIGKAQSMYSRDQGDNNAEIVNDTVEALGNFSKWFTFTESTMFIGKSITSLGKEIYNLGIDTGAVKNIPRLPESNGDFASSWAGIQTGWRVGQTFVAMTDDDLCYDLAKKYGWTPE